MQVCNGLYYEKNTNFLTFINSEYNIKWEILKVCENYTLIKNNKIDIEIVNPRKLHKYMKKFIDNTIDKAHGCKIPDECFISKNTKTLFILEKKFQKVSGSVCEKIQTSDFKIWHYTRLFPSWKIIYIYCLSDWFKENCKEELEYLKFKKVDVFFGEKSDYFFKLSEYFINYFN